MSSCIYVIAINSDCHCYCAECTQVKRCCSEGYNHKATTNAGNKTMISEVADEALFDYVNFQYTDEGSS
jgi:hypothetical protein